MSALLLTPGASASRDHPSLVSIDDAVRAAPSLRGASAVAVERIDLPKGKAERAVPVAVAAAAALASAPGSDGRVFLGGRSFGGRVCSMAVATGDVPSACGLVLISYPLHPPGKPLQLRTEHFPALRVPCLFVSGTRDSFGRPEELEAAAVAIAGAVTHVWIDGGDHGLRGKDAEVAAAVVEWLGSV